MRRGIQSFQCSTRVVLSSLCMGSWVTSFILLGPSSDSQVETSSTILSRQTQTMPTGSLLLREESEHLQTQHVKNRTKWHPRPTLVLSLHHLQYHSVTGPPRQLSPQETSAPSLPHVASTTWPWFYSGFLLWSLESPSNLSSCFEMVIKEQLLTFIGPFYYVPGFVPCPLNVFPHLILLTKLQWCLVLLLFL